MKHRASAKSTAPEYLRDDEIAAWQGLLHVSGRVLRELDAALRDAHGITVGEFDVLITLVNAPRMRSRMTELADRVSLSAAGLSHMITRLEREKLVAREVDADDRRGFHAVLTRRGLERLNAARPSHNAVIRRAFLDRITAKDRRALGRIWASVMRDEN
jgi:DNA-binding MarR family transcriptional regulator